MKQKFRLRVIPATLTWAFGGILLIGTPFRAYYTWMRFPIDSNFGYSYKLSCYLAVATVPCCFIAGLLIIFAGTQWIRGKWLGILIPYAIVCTMVIAMKFLHYAIWKE